MLLAFLTAVLAGCAPASHPILTEVLYDAVGDDTGHEYLELLNPLATRASLAGLRIEAGDGSNAGRWTLRWTGGTADSLAPGARFVIGGALVTPPANGIVSLDLQNGPDAVRLVWPDGAIEVVGWGAHELPEYFCGAPAPDAPSGFSIARWPDLSNSGANADDFRVATPSPGRANQVERDLALVAGSLVADPERADPALPLTLRARLGNAGAVTIAAGEASCAVIARETGGAREVGRMVLPLTLAPAESSDVTIAVSGLAAGRVRLIARVELPGDANADNDADSLQLRVGEPPWRIAEIQFHPTHGEGEWIELEARSAEAAGLAGWTASDRSGSRGQVRDAAAGLAPRRVLLAQDRVAFAVAYPQLDTARVLALAPWPALNNSDDASGSADEIVLREPDGTLADRVSYHAGGVPSGVPIERLDGEVWQPSGDPAGTPLAPPRDLPALTDAFVVAPAKARIGEAVRLSWSLPWSPARVAVRVFDLAGRPAAVALAEVRVTGRGEAQWTPSDLAPGIYLLALEARGLDATTPLAATCVLRIARATP